MMLPRWKSEQLKPFFIYYGAYLGQTELSRIFVRQNQYIFCLAGVFEEICQIGKIRLLKENFVPVGG